MDPGHHTAFLLAILICILLLLLAVSSLLMCYWRRNGFKMTNRTSSMRFGRLARDQATSMTSFTLNVINPKLHLQNDPKESQAFSLPITVDQSSQKSTSVTSHLSRDSHIMSIGDEEEGLRTSIVDKPVQKKSRASEHFSTLQRMLSGASIFGGVLEKSSMFSLKAKRRSSSLKSGVDVDISMIPLESPVRVSSNGDQFHAAGSQRDLSRSSTVLCENSSEQQFTWDTAGLSVLSRHSRKKESFSLPNTLERKTEEDSSKQNTQLGKTDFLQPKAWFIFIGNRPVSEGAQLENELNNVTSLDSGVDVIEPVVRDGFGGFKSAQMPISTQDAQCHIPSRRSNENPEEINGDEEKQEECLELHITHQEAARNLNPRHYSRSLWEKREERPLIGAN
ncbi:uncharacterized protein LOC120929383 [Rana temporaria]|uniref:uncharacterized protein LOC120929383 n=1 Tax=Rana temporaria TaxID=8407 RepID=UPI001AACB5D7|nr:uncharacterized protein LOC120929383 [Rana temporaria]